MDDDSRAGAQPPEDTETPLVLVVGHTLGGRLERVTLELLADARKLARSLGGRVELVFVTSASVFQAMEPELRQHVHERIHLLEHPDRERPSSDAALLAVRDALERLGPRVVMIGATTYGRELAPRLAAQLGMGYLPHVLTLKPSRGKITVTRVSHGGRAHRQAAWPGERPVILTMKPGVGEPPPPQDRPSELEVERWAPALPRGRTRVLELIPPDPRTQDITEAERLVAGGRGVGSPEGFRVVEALADALGASVAASRVVTDLGWVNRERQVGQTGKTVTPQLYVAVGISGASHHLAGMRSSQKIVAVNTDPEAPIFSVAHFGTIGDLHEVLPRLTRLVSERRETSEDREAGAETEGPRARASG